MILPWIHFCDINGDNGRFGVNVLNHVVLGKGNEHVTVLIKSRFTVYLPSCFDGRVFGLLWRTV